MHSWHNTTARVAIEAKSEQLSFARDEGSVLVTSCTLIDLYVYFLKKGNIRMVVICYASNIIEYGRRTPELSNTPLHMKQDTNKTILENLRFRGLKVSRLD